MQTITAALDIGGSETRYKSSSGLQIYDSEFVLFEDGELMVENLKDPLSVMSISINGVNYNIAKGEALNYLKGKLQFCDNNTLKAQFDGTYLNVIYAVARDAIMRSFRETDVTIGVALPPNEVFGNAKTLFRGKLNTTVQVKPFMYNDDTYRITFSTSQIKIYPEGVVAVFSIEDQSVVTRIQKSSVAIIDIGYRSTDISLLRNGSPYRGAFRSAPIGGINVEAMLVNFLENNGIYLARDDIRGILTTGTTILNSQNVYYGEVVKRIKAQFAGSIKDELVQLLNSAGLSLTSVNMFYPVGRPFDQTGIPNDSRTDGGCLTDILSSVLGIEAIRNVDNRTSNVLGVYRALGNHD